MRPNANVYAPVRRLGALAVMHTVLGSLIHLFIFSTTARASSISFNLLDPIDPIFFTIRF